MDLEQLSEQVVALKRDVGQKRDWHLSCRCYLVESRDKFSRGCLGRPTIAGVFKANRILEALKWAQHSPENRSARAAFLGILKTGKSLVKEGPE